MTPALTKGPNMLDVLVAGIISGCIYALSGAAFMVAYRSSRILNFALGGFGGLASFVAVSLDTKVPWVAAFLVALAVGAAVGALSEVVVGRRLNRISPLAATIGMLGVLLVLQGAIEYFWGTTGSVLRAPLGQDLLHIGSSVTVAASGLVTVGAAILGCAGLFGLFYRTRYGLQMRAVTEGPMTAETLGIRVSRTATVGWAVSGLLGAAAAVFVGESSTLLPSTYTDFLFLALIALVVGGFTTISGVMLGGLLFGIGLSFLQTELSTQLTYSFSFVILCALLFVRPQGLLGRPEAQLNEPSLQLRRNRAVRDALRKLGASNHLGPVSEHLGALRENFDISGTSRRQRVAGLSVVIAVSIALWWIAPITVVLSLPIVVSNFLAVLGLDIMLGYCGQLNLAQGAFVAIGAYGGALSVLHWGFPAWSVLPISAVSGALFGVLIGLPAMRLAHLYFAQVTLLFSFVVPELITYFQGFTGGSTGISVTPIPQSGTLSGYLIYLGIAATCVAAVLLLLRSRLGRHWRGIRDSEDVAKSLGQRTWVAKLCAFAVGCGLAGLAGGMQALSVGTLAPDSFPVWLSLYYQAATVIGGMTSLLGNVLAAFFITVVPLYTGAGSRIPGDLIFGAVLVIVMLVAPRGLGPTVTSVWRALWNTTGSGLGYLLPSLRSAHAVPPARRGSQPISAAATPRPGYPADAAFLASAANPPIAGAPAVLELTDVRAGYRGGEVLHSVSISLPQNTIVGIVGPNGAGKSTLLRCATGLLAVQAGAVYYHGHDIRHEQAFQIARRGIAQVVQGRGIFPGLTVRENLNLGQLYSRTDRASRDVGFEEWVFQLFPRLKDRLSQPSGTLSGGEQQMLAIARSLLMHPDCLVLDEPFLGLAPVAVEIVISALEQVQQAGLSILLVEQNIKQVLTFCQHVYLLAGGNVAASGPATEMRERADLLETYFGIGEPRLQ